MTATTATPVPSLRARRVAAVTAIVAGAALVVKVFVIVITGNGAPETLETVLFGVGALLPLVTAGAIAAGRTGWLRRIGTGIGIAFGHLVYITMLSEGVGAAVGLLTDQAHLTDELPLALLGAVWLAIGLRMRARSHA